ncbi:hypothetical protein A2765_01450 [Candidatus Kaiserbacteria bacterium RIFCSPHIGHO2_01_FULL_56_24]|uniref:Glutathionylspermidine synthase pre-ATP-grasp-like domain-containing protein n=1 Tax=Candidatus Kaiserbacteria bacterium RIFCSPHIGHO2_01_FULL_56_24 TaxID=1798487 RepID=A0A1F6DIC5_9BACT|nr:MAG: hypothetical protein A2765_01450 [Candidatus Kaiserbacteria bacterium RIFCSPHIGHO2_01_FULL_56_24]
MQRTAIDERPNWKETVESQGFPFHTAGVRPDGDITSGTYWNERVYYELTSAQVDELEDATNELHARCLDAVGHMCANPDLLRKLAIPEAFHAYIIESWKRRDPSIYGRFDLAYDGKSPPKLLEYNGDTPTTLIETSVIQWHWLEDRFRGKPAADQFNSVHEKLIEAWKNLSTKMSKGTPLYFAAIKDNVEEYATVEYLRDTAHQAGLKTEFIYLQDLGWDSARKVFVGNDGQPINYCFKLYPWEWMFQEEFGQHLLTAACDTGFIEPPWKAVLSNKGILPILWELFPEHPNLLPAFWQEDPRLGDSYIVKPIMGREGANMRIVSPGADAATDGDYGDQPMIYQKLASLGIRDGNHISIGSWVVAGEAAGICVREDTSKIIVDKSPLVPHIFR